MEWISVKDKLPNQDGWYLGRTSYGSIVNVVFWEDKCVWTAFYGVKISYWWDAETNKPLHDIVHWCHINKNTEKINNE